MDKSSSSWRGISLAICTHFNNDNDDATIPKTQHYKPNRCVVKPAVCGVHFGFSSWLGCVCVFVCPSLTHSGKPHCWMYMCRKGICADRRRARQMCHTLTQDERSQACPVCKWNFGILHINVYVCVWVALFGVSIWGIHRTHFKKASLQKIPAAHQYRVLFHTYAPYFRRQGPSSQPRTNTNTGDMAVIYCSGITAAIQPPDDAHLWAASHIETAGAEGKLYLPLFGAGGHCLRLCVCVCLWIGIGFPHCHSTLSHDEMMNPNNTHTHSHIEYWSISNSRTNGVHKNSPSEPVCSMLL